jgi:uncharacterized protein involved in outer membrane biogenesis
MLKPSLKFITVTLLILLLLAFFLPIVFKTNIITTTKKNLSENLFAKIEFEDLNISLLKHFPKLAVEMEALHIEGMGEFSEDTLLSAKKIAADISIISLISGNHLRMYSLLLDEPRVNAIVHKNGNANWNISKRHSLNTADFSLQLDKYAVKNAYIKFVDETNGSFSEIKNLTHQGSGDFAAEKFMLKKMTESKNAMFLKPDSINSNSQ